MQLFQIHFDIVLCCSRKYLYPPPSPQKGLEIPKGLEGRGGGESAKAK